MGETDPEERALVRREATPLADPYEREYMRGQGLVLHRTKQRAPWQLNALFGVIAVASMAPIVAGLPSAWIGALFTLPILFVVWMLFAVLRVTVSEGSVDVQYGLFGPKIPIASIESAEPTTYHWARYGGWGIRRGPGGEWLYNMPGDKGRAVRVVWRDAKGRRKVTLIGSSDPHGIADAIARARQALPAGASPPPQLPGDDG
ncbi:MAG: hypothetical protein H6712_18125 [Myxococcales bacterium]|nr:hypothetical protein [Myxococcales bacterium]MCB9715790.1 hypothetical protein [Myxococcales bacterium]